ncbi:biotin-dependent carboxyltransferase family protein [Gaetbulibacter jejuensis]|uniref:5-oxoprolinase subunit C family protein n=1 Tax=Gaetbulibacter jejuensis TaxID=584607 RepID=UPI003008BEE5
MVEVLKSGLFSTIQDLGRFGFQRYGIPFSGAMDTYSSKIANTILGNNENDAVLEITMTGPTLLFKAETVICLTGADLSPKLNDVSISLNKAIKVKPGYVLSFGKLNYGYRCYLAVLGGFQSESVMESKSMFSNVTKADKIAVGDSLKINTTSVFNLEHNATLKVNTNHFKSKTIEVFEGPEFESLSDSQKALLFNQEFSVSQLNNRMAYQLNEKLENNLAPIITSMVLPGTIQLTPSGKLIVLMRDCQTTGGYPRVLHLNELSISRLAQKKPNEKIRLKLLKQ